jgi:hypothetical protein|nr:MAG TPA: Protein of unknown function (DUF1642) [Caudoviricetes sp.]
MNKKELIKKIKEMPYNDGILIDTIKVNRGWLLRNIKELEPEKVTIPQFVADWIEHFKKTSDWDLFQAMDYLFEHTITCEWIETKDNQELFARAWIFGYEVEKEPKYIVKLKNGQPLVKAPLGGKFYFNQNITAGNYKATRKEIEDAGFGEVFNSPLFEVVEVEE